MSAHVAVPHTAPGRVLAELLEPLALLLSALLSGWVVLRPKLVAAWRVSWPALPAVPVGVGIGAAGMALQDSGHDGWAMLVVLGSLLVVVFALAWTLSDGES